MLHCSYNIFGPNPIFGMSRLINAWYDCLNELTARQKQTPSMKMVSHELQHCHNRDLEIDHCCLESYCQRDQLKYHSNSCTWHVPCMLSTCPYFCKHLWWSAATVRLVQQAVQLTCEREPRAATCTRRSLHGSKYVQC